MRDCNLVRQWVAALRSGEYKQGHRVLRSKDDKFCCLGVLCDTISSEMWTPNIFTSTFFWSRGVGLSATLDEETRNSVGMTNDEQYELIKMNDDRGKSLKEIARRIEEMAGINVYR